MAAGAITLGANTTDRIDLGVVAAATGLSALSYLVLLRPAALVDARGIFTVGQTAVIQSPFARLSGTSGNVEFFQQRSTTNAQYITSNNPLSGINVWKAMAFVLDLAAGAGEIMNIYHGTPGIAVATECAYAVTKIDGAGTAVANSGASLIIANRNLSTPDRSWQGDYGVSAFIPAALTQAQVASWFGAQRSKIGTLSDAVAFGRPSLVHGAASWKDYKGNTPTLSGGVAANGPRLDISLF